MKILRNYSGGNRSDRGRDFGKKRGRDSERPSMHQATCDNCGKNCEVPFKPTSGKPIYCSSCFDKSQTDGPKKYGKERSDRNFRSGDSRKRSFENRDFVSDNRGKETDQFKKEIELLNKKLDKILEILTAVPSEENYEGELEEETEKPKVKKVTKKKAVTKKSK